MGSDHVRHIQIYQPEKTGLAEHQINFKDTMVWQEQQDTWTAQWVTPLSFGCTLFNINMIPSKLFMVPNCEHDRK
jgi:hypothetical protein